MNRLAYMVIALSFTLGIIGGAVYFQKNVGDNKGNTNGNNYSSFESVVKVFKGKYCGCCELYVGYLENKGFKVNVTVVEDIQLEHKKFGVADEMSSCHISEIGGYVVVGHVPVEAIEKLLKERPEIRGIALPGMPSGSPGMPGEKLKPFVIYSLHDSGTDVFMKL